MESAKPKVLLFTDWYLPGYKAGGPIRSCANLIAALGDEIAFWVVCSDRDYLDAEPYQNVETDRWTVRGKAQIMYLSRQKQTFGTVRELIAEHPDHSIYINGIFSRVFSVFPLLATSRLNRPSIVAPRGMLAPGALGIKRNKKIVYLQIAKKFGLFRHATFHATNDHEAGHIRSRIIENNNVKIIPNLPNASAKSTFPEKESNAIGMLCVARIAREKNIDFALECLKSIPKEITVQMRFVGSVYDQNYFEDCSEMAIKIPENVHVKFMGALPPKALVAEYAKAHLFFLPTLGENYGHAIAEALLANTPVLISDQTPWRNLAADGLGADFPLDDSQKFSDFIVEVAKMDNAAYQKNFNHIAEKVKRRIDLNDSISKYKSLFA